MNKDLINHEAHEGHKEKIEPFFLSYFVFFVFFVVYNFLYMNKYINTNGELHECID